MRIGNAMHRRFHDSGLGGEIMMVEERDRADAQQGHDCHLAHLPPSRKKASHAHLVRRGSGAIVAAGVLPRHRPINAEGQSHQRVAEIEIPNLAGIKRIEQRLPGRAVAQHRTDLRPVESGQERDDDNKVEELRDNALDTIDDPSR